MTKRLRDLPNALLTAGVLVALLPTVLRASGRAIMRPNWLRLPSCTTRRVCGLRWRWRGRHIWRAASGRCSTGSVPTGRSAEPEHGSSSLQLVQSWFARRS